MQIGLARLCPAPIVPLGFRHSIVGAVQEFYLAARGAVGWGTMLGGFVAPAVPGNVVGGVVLVTLRNRGQLSADQDADAEATGSARV